MNKEEREETFKEIINFVQDGNSLKESCDKSRITRETFYKWIKEDETKSDTYARAREYRSDLIFEEILDIADNSGRDKKLNDEGIEVVDHENIQRDKLRVDARKWMLSKMNPKKFGEKLQVDSSEIKIMPLIPLNDSSNDSDK